MRSIEQTVTLARPSLLFQVDARDGAARAGLVRTAHGTFHTPTFMAVGTTGGVKAVPPADVRAAGIEVMLGNTYHLLLRPGCVTVAALGGLHRFAGWQGPMLTDSGGFQVYSLAQRAVTSDAGVTFASHRDGSRIELTPELSMECQRLLGADIVMQFDDVPALPASQARLSEATDRSIAWAERCKAAHRGVSEQGHPQYLFGIQQGGLDRALRERSIRALIDIGMDGYAIGGLSVGEAKADMHRAFYEFAPMLPQAQLRYVMGVGYPEDILAAVQAGIDVMDCVAPTRCGRHGLALTSVGRLHLKRANLAKDCGPLDPNCACSTCATFSRGYLRHLITCGEMLGFTLLTIHNLAYYARLMADARNAIMRGGLAEFCDRTRERWQAGDTSEATHASGRGTP